MKACIASGTDSDRIPYVFGGGTRERFAAVLDLLPSVVARSDLEGRRAELAEVEAILCTWGMESLDGEEIETYFPRLRAVFYVAGSVRYFARPFLERGIRVFSAARAMAIPVAEFAVAQIALANKRTFLAAALARAGDWKAAHALAEAAEGSYGAKVGVLGAGLIGSRVLELLPALGIEALAWDPFASDEKLAALGARRASLEKIFSSCATISNHLADNAETRGLLDYRLFRLMRKDAVFVNTGRGAQVSEADLARALREEPLRSALLDVTWPEPPAATHEFRSLPNVILTPHIAGMGRGEVRRMADAIIEEIRAFKEGREPLCEVTLPMLATMA